MKNMAFSTKISLVSFLLAMILLLISWGEIGKLLIFIVLSLQFISIIFTSYSLFKKKDKKINLFLFIFNFLPWIYLIVAFSYGITQSS